MKSYICQTCGTQFAIAAVGDGAMQMLGNAGLLIDHFQVLEAVVGFAARGAGA